MGTIFKGNDAIDAIEMKNVIHFNILQNCVILIHCELRIANTTHSEWKYVKMFNLNLAKIKKRVELFYTRCLYYESPLCEYR